MLINNKRKGLEAMALVEPEMLPLRVPNLWEATTFSNSGWSENAEWNIVIYSKNKFLKWAFTWALDNWARSYVVWKFGIPLKDNF